MKNQVVFLLLLFFTCPIFATTITWTGTTGNWDDAANWSTNTVPTASDDVIIPSGTVRIPIGYAAFAESVDVTGYLIIRNNASLTLDGGQDAMVIHTGGVVDNRGAIGISNTTGHGISVSGGSLINNAIISAELNIGATGVFIDQYGSFDNAATGEITIDNASSNGIQLISGSSLTNSGILRLRAGIYGYGLDLDVTSFDNNACASLLTDAKLDLHSGTLNNYGWIRSRFVGSHNTTIVNSGVIEDNPGAFAGTNNGVIINRITGNYCEGSTIADAFALGNLTNYTITNNQWYVDEALSVSAGTYAPAQNKFDLAASAVGSDELYAEFTDNTGVCSIVMRIKFTNTIKDLQPYYADADGDGYGDAGTQTLSCGLPPGHVTNSDDCDDTDPNINPAAIDNCNGVDDNCNGQIDEDPDVTYYLDADGDGYGDPALNVNACSPPDGYVANSDDCDDTDPNVNPNALDICNNIDDDCDGLIDEDPQSIFYADLDGDGFGDPNAPTAACAAPADHVADNSDCDDTDPNVNPNAIDICNNIDDDCDGLIDEDPQSIFYADLDGDGFGDPNAPTAACAAPADHVADNSDCDDSNPNVNPNALDICNGFDDDCDGLIDEDPQSIFYADLDGDGFGDPNAPTAACAAPADHVADNSDCDDTDPNVNPNAVDICNNIDDDCDGLIDEDPQSIFYADLDGDGFGDPNAPTAACAAPADHVADNSDCDDTNPNVNPNALDICNNIDDDCDGLIDEDPQSIFYADLDGDGFGDPNAPTAACAAPADHVADNSDCDDTNPNVNPNAVDICNNIDDDCDGLIDEDPQSIFYADLDGDGFGDPNAPSAACAAPADHVADNSDCDDTDPNVNPNALDICNNIDDDCDGLIDEDPQSIFYADLDGDGFGDPNAPTAACAAPADHVADNSDCDDSDPNVNPNAIDICNNIDDDCDGLIDEDPQSIFYADLDGDGFGDPNAPTAACAAPADHVADNSDCDDTDPNVNPNALDICNNIDDDCDGLIDEDPQSIFYADLDGDGFGDPNAPTAACAAPADHVADNSDCDDTNPNVNPNAIDICNNIDDDCDGLIDEDPQSIFYADLDGDGFGDPNAPTAACAAPADHVADNSDCDDTDPNVNPNALDICNNIDDDCDGLIDEDPQSIFYADLDGDGFGDPNAPTAACAAPADHVADNSDCDDTNPNVNPNALDICNNIDDDCDGLIDEDPQSIFYADLDGDGFGDPNAPTAACAAPADHVADNSDCDDTNPNVNPNALDICNNIDDDCDGLIDEDPQSIFYADLDGDGFGDPNAPTAACAAPADHVADNSDCDDTNPNVNPNAVDICNNIDDDCDGLIDEDPQSIFYADLDGDGFGDPNAPSAACAAPADHVADNSDCDDTDPNVNPNALDICNNIDDDCDGLIDEDPQSIFYADLDGDGFGDPNAPTAACAAPTDHVADNSDCDDTNPNVNPNALDICNNIDDDCDGLIDEDPQSIFYADLDGDGFGDPNAPTAACAAPADHVADNSDCDDTNPNVNPNALDICNNIDDDCDGLIDEDPQSIFYADLDGDGFGDPNAPSAACAAPADHVADNSDCDDTNPNVNPNALDICNNIDDDCDGLIDEDPQSIFYADLDGDGFGDPNAPTAACAAPADHVADNSDCDDTNPNVNPNALDICNNIDDDCDGLIDEDPQSIFYADLDGDGFGDPNAPTAACAAPADHVADNTDCDDTDPNVNPNALDICNGFDDDCDGLVDEDPQSIFYADLDGDGFGDPNAPTVACAAPADHVADNTDCDDTDPNVNPAATEACNGIDDDCNNLVDDNTCEGNTCAAPINFSALPFHHSGSTEFMGNNYTTVGNCSSSYITGNDMVFTYTASGGQIARIILEKTSTVNGSNAISMFVLDGCPDNCYPP